MLESSFRLTYRDLSRVLRERLSEHPPTRIQLLSGPRQVGKTTLLLDLSEEWGERALYLAADAPEASLPGMWDRTLADAEARATSGEPVLLLLDEVAHLPDWAVRLKGAWDRVLRRRIPLHVVATGSSALQVARGSSESLAGRFEKLTLTHWSADALAEELGCDPQEAADLVVRQGAYPGAFALRQDLPRWRAYVRDAIVEPALGRDLLALTTIRKPALLKQIFALSAQYPCGIVSLQKLQGQLQDRGALETLAHYLALLEDAYLVAALPKYSPRALRRRSAPPKLVPLSNAFLAVTDPRGIPDREREPERFGFWVENACLAYAWSSGQSLHYWREGDLEVDAVVEGSWGNLALEVKTGALVGTDLRGLTEFCSRHPEFRPFLVTGEEGLTAAARLGVPAIHWREFLSGGPPRR